MRHLFYPLPFALWAVAWFLSGCGQPDDTTELAVVADAATTQDNAAADTPAGDSPHTDVSEGDVHDAMMDAVTPDAEPGDAAQDRSDGGDADTMGPCPLDMTLVDSFCMDRYEAPNQQGGLPLVMFTFLEAESWCVARNKRLCFHDEWTRACGGDSGWAYPYGDEHDPGVCNDDKLWKTYNQDLLNGWPWDLPTDSVESLDDLIAMATADSAAGAAAANHVLDIYQADPSGSNAQCVDVEGVYDLTGNIEEWTRRRDGGEPQFHGMLKGRYWAETRTCQNGVTTHGDSFRFYEIGFRCCRDPS